MADLVFHSLLLTGAESDETRRREALKRGLLLLAGPGENIEMAALKKSLLITHGTIYGTVVYALPMVQFAALTSSIARHDTAWEGPEGLWFHVGDVPGAPAGALIDNAPIDMVHWDNTATDPQNGLWHWQGCMTLLTRV